MSLKIPTFFFIAWAFTVFFDVPTANGYALLPDHDDITRIVVTGKREAVQPFSACGRTFSYRQLMTIPGFGAVWVPVESVYPPGPQEAVLVERCENGNFLYGLDSCGC